MNLRFLRRFPSTINCNLVIQSPAQIWDAEVSLKKRKLQDNLEWSNTARKKKFSDTTQAIRHPQKQSGRLQSGSCTLETKSLWCTARWKSYLVHINPTSCTHKFPRRPSCSQNIFIHLRQPTAYCFNISY